MPSITNESNGRRTIQFVGKDGKRRSIRLGRVSRKFADRLLDLVEHLIEASITGCALEPSIARRVTELDGLLYDRIAKGGLLVPRSTQNLGGFIDAYIADRIDVKPATTVVYKRVRRYMVSHFGSDCLLRSITPAQADQWRLKLIKEGLADNTVRRSCGVAKQWFRSAMKQGLVELNPFNELVASVRGNTSRYYFRPLRDLHGYTSKPPWKK